MELPNLSLLPALAALLETESVSLAAHQLRITQPAMSRTLQRLRDATGDELLVKVGRGMRRTTRGDVLWPRAQAALSQAASVLAPPLAFSPATATGAVTLSMGDDLQAIAGGAILLRLRERAPGLDVRLRSLTFKTVDEARRGEVDVALVPNIAGYVPDLSDFVLKPLYERRFVTVASRRRRLDLDAFCAADHVLVSPGGTDEGFVDDQLKAIGRKRRVAMTVQSFGAAVQVLLASDSLISTLPHDLVRVLGPSLRQTPCPVATPRFPICLCWHARVSTDARHRFVRDVVTAAIVDIARPVTTRKTSKPTRTARSRHRRAS